VCSDKPDARPEINEDFEAILAGRKRRKLSEMAKDVKGRGIEDLIENIDKGKLDTTFKDATNEDAILKDLAKLQNEFAAFTGGKPKQGTLAEVDKKKVEQLLGMMNKWESKSYIGNVFRKEFPKGSPQAQSMKEMTPEQLDKFRKDWCKGHVEKLELKKVQTTSWGRVDKTKGTYRTVGNMIMLFGGWKCEDAVKGALTVASKCSGLGPPWCKKHAQSELLEFLLLETEFEETFATSWQMFKEEILEQQEPSIAKESGITLPVTSTAIAVPKATQPKGAIAVPKAKGAIVVPKATQPKPTDKSRLEVANMAKETSKVRRDYQSASAQYLDITSNMEEKEEWAWAKTSPMIKSSRSLGSIWPCRSLRWAKNTSSATTLQT